MTREEQRSINQLGELLVEIKKSNDLYRELLTKKVDDLEKTVTRKHLPVMFEDKIMESIDAALSKAMHEALTGYNSPLTQYAKNIVEKYKPQIEAVFDEVIQEAIKTDEFKQRVREVMLHKIAKTMIAGIDGSIDKTVNQMKQDAVFRSRLTLAVNGLVDEFLKPNHQ